MVEIDALWSMRCLQVQWKYVGKLWDVFDFYPTAYIAGREDSKKLQNSITNLCKWLILWQMKFNSETTIQPSTSGLM